MGEAVTQVDVEFFPHVFTGARHLGDCSQRRTKNLLNKDFFKPRKFALHVQMLGALPGTFLLVVPAGSASFLRGVESSLLCWETISGSSKWVCHFLPSTKDHTPGGQGMPALGDEPW